MKFKIFTFLGLLLMGFAQAQMSPSSRSNLLISGRISDTANIGVVGAQIMLIDSSGPATSAPMLAFAVSGANGMYSVRLSGRSSGLVNIRVVDCAGNMYFGTVSYSGSGTHVRNFTVACRIRVPSPPPPPAVRCNADFGFRPDTGLGVRFMPVVMDTTLGYSWSFGDGNTSTAVSPTHYYASGGMYTVRLIVRRIGATASTSCSDTESRVVSVPVPPRPPVGNPWSIPCNPRFGARIDTTLTVGFRSVLQDTTATFAWNFGDGSTTVGRNPSHTYAAAGQYVVVLAVSRVGASASQSCTDTAWLRISVPGHRRPRVITNPTPVPPPAPCASTYMVVPDTAPLGYVFVARPVSNRRTYSWTFGDGSTGTGPVVRHTYGSAGSFVVCLTVTDSASNCTFNRCDTLVASSLRSTNGGGLAPRTGSSNASSLPTDVKLSLYPNPVRDALNLTFKGGNGQAIVRVMDLTGRVVLSHAYRLGLGIQQESLSVGDLPLGTYMLTLDRDGKREYSRFVKN